MTPASRAAQFAKLQKVLRKCYSPVEPDANRPVLEQLIYGCVLENAPYAAADEAYAALVHGFFDWNEVRVSTVRELAEAMPGLPDPPAAANRVKRVLQSVFESTYAFELEELRKLNLGPAAERLKKTDGASDFAVAYVVQASLGGHSIPIDAGTLRALYVVDLVTQDDLQEGAVPGLERAIPKSKGIEFGSLLHQLGADFVADPYSSQLRDILTQIEPTAAERLPKRRARRTTEPLLGLATLGEAPPAEASPVARSAKRAAGAPQAPGKSAERKKKVEPAPTVAARAGEPTPTPESRQEPARAEKPPTPEKPEKATTDQAEAVKKKPTVAKKKPADKATQQPPEKQAEKAIEKAPPKPTEPTPAKPVETAGQTPTHQPPEKKKPAAPPLSSPSAKSKPEAEPSKKRPETGEISKRKPR